jgi:uncharacterized protein (TIGR02996 family)
MNTADAFLADICNRPNDNAVRMIYADWLEDHNDAARAEIIRLQCKLRGLPIGHADRPDLEQRERKLLDRHSADWLSALPRFSGVYWQRSFQRGFADAVEAGTWSSFERQADAIFAASPVQRLLLRKLNGPLGEIFSSPHLPRLLELDIRHHPLGDLGLVYFTLLPGLVRWESLSLVDVGISSRGMVSLVGFPFLDSLTTLRLSFPGVGDAGATRLASLPQAARLTALELCSGGIGDLGALALAGSAHLGNLTQLLLPRNHIGMVGVLALAQSPHLAKVQRLDLRGNSLTAGEKRLVQGWFGERLIV